VACGLYILIRYLIIDGWPSRHFVQLDGYFMLEAAYGNRHFLIVKALVNKTICVTTSHFCFIAENFRILIFCLLNTMMAKNVKSHVLL
jgi:hypothetical protein